MHAAETCTLQGGLLSANIGRGTSNSILSSTIIWTTRNTPYLLLSQLIGLHSIMNYKHRKAVHLLGVVGLRAIVEAKQMRGDILGMGARRSRDGCTLMHAKKLKFTWYSNLIRKELTSISGGCPRINWGVSAYQLGGVPLPLPKSK